MVLYFSGTGNSKYIAKRIAEAIQENAVDLNMKIKKMIHRHCRLAEM
nr:hypothetical protein [Dorea formicigenerans]